MVKKTATQEEALPDCLVCKEPRNPKTGKCRNNCQSGRVRQLGTGYLARRVWGQEYGGNRAFDPEKLKEE